MFQFQSQHYSTLALHDAKCHFYTFAQDKHMVTCQQYHEMFKNNVKVIEYCRGMLGNDPGLVDAKLMRAGLDHAGAMAAQVTHTEGAARECMLAYSMCFSDWQ
jgi:hypothetical protein